MCLSPLSACPVLLCAALCCSVLPCAALCCSVLLCAALCCSVLLCAALCCPVLPCAALCCPVLPCASSFPALPCASLYPVLLCALLSARLPGRRRPPQISNTAAAAAADDDDDDDAAAAAATAAAAYVPFLCLALSSAPSPPVPPVSALLEPHQDKLESLVGESEYASSLTTGRLVPLTGESEYASSLASGRVAVIVEEDPYLDLFSASFCDGVQASQPFSILNFAFVGAHSGALWCSVVQCGARWCMCIMKIGCWDVVVRKGMYMHVNVQLHLCVCASAFPKESQVGADISQAILELTMKGELERLKAQYLQKDNMCVDDQTASAVLTEVNVQKFSALLILYLVVSLLCCITYVGILINRGYRYHLYDLVTAPLALRCILRRLKTHRYHLYDLVTAPLALRCILRRLKTHRYHLYDLVTAPLALRCILRRLKTHRYHLYDLVTAVE
ncbi:unnamed protein product [Closterium sp. NIES-54]